jgi:hypothetical protein
MYRVYMPIMCLCKVESWLFLSQVL